MGKGTLDSGPITAETVAGKIVAVNVGGSQFRLIRDTSTHVITGVRASSGQVFPLGIATGVDTIATRKKSIAKGSEKPTYDLCGIGGPFALEVAELPRVEVDGNRAPQPDFWISVLPAAFPSDAELASSNGGSGSQDLAERFQRRKDKKDACVSKVKTSGLIASACTCVKVADEIKTKRPKSGIIAILAGAACQVAADMVGDEAIKICESAELVCRATP